MRTAGILAIDAALIAAAWLLAFVVRFDGAVPGAYWRLAWVTLVPVVLITLATFLALRLYARWWRFTSLVDLERLLIACVVSTAIATLVLVLWHPLEAAVVPRGVFALSLVFVIGLVAGARVLVRTVAERRAMGARDGRPVLVYGAGAAGNALLRDLRTSGVWRPVGLVDDDPRKRGMHLGGTRVRGARADLARIIRRTGACEVIIAMPSAPGAVRRDIADICRRAGVRATTLPGLAELMSGDLSHQLREVGVEDVLGRAPVALDLARVAGYLNGRRVLITGAGGSIGSELARQVATVGPASLVLVDHSEGNLFEIDAALRERGHRPEAVICDVRDGRALARVLGEHRPEIIFHAAAYKHVPMMEANPLQAIANNALATATLATCAVAHGVERVCLVSTDKAVDPTTVMGATKALAERIIERQGDQATCFAAVRFGNVLGSSGSVLPIFRRQIAAGGPVTVTHPEMTRYFMTIPEAAQLVIEATGIAQGGDVFVLDMGEPVRIMDLAHNAIRLSGHEPEVDIAIAITGIRPGERLHEVLFNADEQVAPTRYQRIMRATRPRLDPAVLDGHLDALRDAVAAGDERAAVDALWDTLATPVRGH